MATTPPIGEAEGGFETRPYELFIGDVVQS